MKYPIKNSQIIGQDIAYYHFFKNNFKENIKVPYKSSVVFLYFLKKLLNKSKKSDDQLSTTNNEKNWQKYIFDFAIYPNTVLLNACIFPSNIFNLLV